MIQPKTTAMSGILLIAGTCMGAGMLALPVVTGPSGFLPAMVINTLCWLFMLATGLLFLEATLWMHEGANVLSIADRFLGRFGKIICGASFLFLYYCLQVSYIAGGTPLFINALPIELSEYLAFDMHYILFACIFGLLVFLGTRVVDRLNWLFMVVAILSFALLIFVGSTQVQTQLLTYKNWGLMFLAAPTLFSAFGYHNIVPTLTFYMNRNRKQMRLAIFFGTLIPFLIYSIWQWMIIGTLPLETVNLAAKEGVPITFMLQDVAGHPWIHWLGSFFAFFALITSLLGVALSMVDFLADGFHVKRTGWQRFVLTVLVFIPPAIFAAKYPAIFNEAIGIAGGYGEAILNGLFPIAVVWVGRYWMKLQTPHEIPGGRFSLITLSVITIAIIALETYHLAF